jgi:hypothetical protein
MKLYVFVGNYQGIPEIVKVCKSRKAKEEFKKYTLIDYVEMPSSIREQLYHEFDWIGSNIFEVEL